MRAVFWKVLLLLLSAASGWESTDVHTLWTNRDVVLVVSLSLLREQEHIPTDERGATL